jgi:hypothetical protein
MKSSINDELPFFFLKLGVQFSLFTTPCRIFLLNKKTAPILGRFIVVPPVFIAKCDLKKTPRDNGLAVLPACTNRKKFEFIFT